MIGTFLNENGKINAVESQFEKNIIDQYFGQSLRYYNKKCGRRLTHTYRSYQAHKWRGTTLS